MTKLSWIIPTVVLAAAIGLLFVISGHWISWASNRIEQTTDDAYVRADVTPSNTRISGTVRKVDANDYQQVVQAGQVLMELDDNDYRAILDEARLRSLPPRQPGGGDEAAEIGIGYEGWRL